jgi:2-oxoadipate dioxygenase/decarboxylase-like protein
MPASPGPHSRIAADSPRDRFTLALFDRLWDEYRRRVSYVQKYEQVIAEHGATFVNDHIAFRTIATQSPSSGIHSLGRIFQALGYRAAGVYHFDDKHLAAVHFQHAHPEFPKLFISELQTWELDDSARQVIAAALHSHRDPIADDELAALARIADGKSAAALLDRLTHWFADLPWSPPAREAVVALNQASQYGAWVLVHGYNVNHFTSLINSHGVDALADIEKTIAALQQAGVPMKAEIEGEPGSKLRQTATEAVTIDVPVMAGSSPSTMPWSYAYFELAQRDWVTDPATGQRYRFEGFLGPQATNLFEMTRRK